MFVLESSSFWNLELETNSLLSIKHQRQTFFSPYTFLHLWYVNKRPLQMRNALYIMCRLSQTLQLHAMFNRTLAKHLIVKSNMKTTPTTTKWRNLLVSCSYMIDWNDRLEIRISSKKICSALLYTGTLLYMCIKYIICLYISSNKYSCSFTFHSVLKHCFVWIIKRILIVRNNTNSSD